MPDPITDSGAQLRRLLKLSPPQSDVRFGSLADLGQPIRDVRFTPQKQTCSSSESMSAKCQ